MSAWLHRLLRPLQAHQQCARHLDTSTSTLAEVSVMVPGPVSFSCQVSTPALPATTIEGIMTAVPVDTVN